MICRAGKQSFIKIRINMYGIEINTAYYDN